jgi:hypothetical protein
VNHIRTYSFWYGCLLALLLELAVAAFWSVTTDDGATPETVKQDLDANYTRLKDLDRRASTGTTPLGTPPGSFNAETPRDIANLTDKYLITGKWERVLAPLVDKYLGQLHAIKDDLAQRSQVLHQPVSDDDERGAWYAAYVAASKSLLTSLEHAKAIAIPEDARPEDLDLESGARLRSEAGLYTMAGTNPDPSQHPLLTTRLRIAERIAGLLIDQHRPLAPNPVIDGHGPAIDQHAVLDGIEWRADTSHALSGPIASYALPTELTLTMHGPLSSLLAVESALERLAEPVTIVVGGGLAVQSTFAPGERKDVAFEPVSCTLTILVLDFSPIRSVPDPSPPAVPGRTRP